MFEAATLGGSRPLDGSLYARTISATKHRARLGTTTTYRCGLRVGDRVPMTRHRILRHPRAAVASGLHRCHRRRRDREGSPTTWPSPAAPVLRHCRHVAPNRPRDLWTSGRRHCVAGRRTGAMQRPERPARDRRDVDRTESLCAPRRSAPPSQHRARPVSMAVVTITSTTPATASAPPEQREVPEMNRVDVPPTMASTREPFTGEPPTGFGRLRRRHRTRC